MGTSSSKHAAVASKLMRSARANHKLSCHAHSSTAAMNTRRLAGARQMPQAPLARGSLPQDPLISTESNLPEACLIQTGGMQRHSEKLTWCTLWAAESSSEPIVSRTGLQRNSEARRWMALGQVAENMSVCLSALVALAMALMCGSNPRSSIRSASSSTRYETLVSLQTRTVVLKIACLA